ncbi:hypothetical protein H5410_040685 [Solanum commersonii]|uniref:Uncharacterized protein n=1 Tax=Solanum commersonii TaxID=4109 RepID=A0A9J5XPI7_SOLCO|nr:hypothetical protein H5410_040685 [Solanum commersonii]
MKLQIWRWDSWDVIGIWAKIHNRLSKSVWQRITRHSYSGSPIHSVICLLEWFIAFLHCPSTTSSSVTLGDRILHRGIIWQLTDCSFISPTEFFPSELYTLEH